VNPLDLLLARALTNERSSLRGAGHDADEAAADAGQTAQVFLRGQFAIRDIDESRRAGATGASVDGSASAGDHRFDCRNRLDGTSGTEPSAVTDHAQDQLFEVRADDPCCGRGSTPPAPASRRIGR